MLIQTETPEFGRQRGSSLPHQHSSGVLDAAFSFGAKLLRNPNPGCYSAAKVPGVSIKPSGQQSSDTPELFRNPPAGPPAAGHRVWSKEDDALQPSQQVAFDLKLLVRIAQHLQLEVHEAKRLATVCKAWLLHHSRLPIADVDLTTPKGKTVTVADVEAALASLSGEVTLGLDTSSSLLLFG